MLDMAIYRSCKIGLLGFGSANRAVGQALRAAGAELSVWDDDASVCARAEHDGFAVVDLRHETLKHLDYLVVSPGIAHRGRFAHDIARRAYQSRCSVVGELALLEQLPSKPKKTVAVTGTNGKTTTVSLLGHFLTQLALDHHVVGNVGTPIFSLPSWTETSIYIFELSSFQLDMNHQSGFHIAVLLNIGSDHLDHHDNFASYVQAKERVFLAGDADDYGFIGIDDASCRALHADWAGGKRNVIALSCQGFVAGGLSLQQGVLWDDFFASRASLRLPDYHGLRSLHPMSLLSSYGVLRALGVAGDAIIALLADFRPLPHRLEEVAEQDGITYINDSKATNIHASVYALGLFANVFWICGGVAKGQDYGLLADSLASVRCAFVLGTEYASLHKVLSQQDACAVIICEDMRSAVHQAAQRARRFVDQTGLTATVLLSPAAASFDQFRNYQERGDAFTTAVQEVLS